MKILRFLVIVSVLCFSTHVFAQDFKTPKKFGGFGKIQLNYSLGINDVLFNQKTNPSQVKITLGKQNDYFGIGLGLAAANFRNRSANGGLNINTISFTLNSHYTFKAFSEKDNKPFMRLGGGYAPKIFRDYSKGFLYEGAIGYVITNKKGARYFIEAQYQVQHFDDFLYKTHNVKAESAGLGIGIWF